jgi:hypothetical protein
MALTQGGRRQPVRLSAADRVKLELGRAAADRERAEQERHLAYRYGGPLAEDRLRAAEGHLEAALRHERIARDAGLIADTADVSDIA